MTSQPNSTGWRDSASEQAQADLDTLLSASLGAALEHLQKNGEFYPFAMSIDTAAGQGNSRVDADPEVDIVFADPSVLGEQPESEDVLTELRRILTARVSNEHRTVEQRACAIVLQVGVPNFGDAVRVDLEHREGIQLMVLAPLKVSGKSRKRVYTYGDLRLLPGQRHVW